MKYLVIPKDSDPFLTNWFDINFFVEGMRVFNLNSRMYTTDGKKWRPLAKDSL